MRRSSCLVQEYSNPTFLGQKNIPRSMYVDNYMYGSVMFWEGDGGSLLQRVGSHFALPMPEWSRIGSTSTIEYRIERKIRSIRKNRISKTGNICLLEQKKLVR